ncbi:major capsid protein [Rhizobium phage RHph_N37]|uniref:Major capsid protein n=1 Tax=Rhizobium phage RHph_N37 TaxID=2509749 RepID=A0A7S5UX95_9CAUD|nr:major capsid protein [Rhizobium phage RHph_N37]
MSTDVAGPNLSDVDKALFIEQYGGAVESQFAKDSIMRQYVSIRPVHGTSTITNNRVGKTSLKKLVPGVRPPADQTPFGKVSLTVDTVVIARDTRSMLNDFQIHFDARSELGKDHGKQISKFFDEAFIIMGIKGALMAAPDFGAGAAKNSIGAGKSITLTTAGDEADPDILAQAITDILVQMEEEEIPVEESLVFVRPTEFNTLLNNNKLMSSEFSSGNGDYAKRKIEVIADTRIVKSARIPREANDDHFLSNPDNGNAYNVSDTEAKAVAVIIHPKSFLAGETIPLTSDIFFSREEKVWYIDSWLSFGVTVNRPDVCGAVFAA